jgi:CheY-like chemotaxis protein
MAQREERSKAALVVDDEPTVRTVMTAILEAHGFEVLNASDGLEAWQMVQECPQSIGLVVTDLMMPRMNGLELLRHLQAGYPDLPVVLVSGMAPPGLAAYLGDRVGFLEKPFTAKALFEMIDATMQPKWIATEMPGERAGGAVVL